MNLFLLIMDKVGAHGRSANFNSRGIKCGQVNVIVSNGQADAAAQVANSFPERQSLAMNVDSTSNRLQANEKHELDHHSGTSDPSVNDHSLNRRKKKVKNIDLATRNLVNRKTSNNSAFEAAPVFYAGPEGIFEQQRNVPQSAVSPEKLHAQSMFARSAVRQTKATGPEMVANDMRPSMPGEHADDTALKSPKANPNRFKASSALFASALAGIRSQQDRRWPTAAKGAVSSSSSETTPVKQDRSSLTPVNVNLSPGSPSTTTATPAVDCLRPDAIKIVFSTTNDDDANTADDADDHDLNDEAFVADGHSEARYLRAVSAVEVQTDAETYFTAKSSPIAVEDVVYPDGDCGCGLDSGDASYLRAETSNAIEEEEHFHDALTTPTIIADEKTGRVHALFGSVRKINTENWQRKISTPSVGYENNVNNSGGVKNNVPSKQQQQPHQLQKAEPQHEFVALPQNAASLRRSAAAQQAIQQSALRKPSDASDVDKLKDVVLSKAQIKRRKTKMNREILRKVNISAHKVASAEQRPEANVGRVVKSEERTDRTDTKQQQKKQPPQHQQFSPQSIKNEHVLPPPPPLQKLGQTQQQQQQRIAASNQNMQMLFGAAASVSQSTKVNHVPKVDSSSPVKDILVAVDTVDGDNKNRSSNARRRIPAAALFNNIPHAADPQQQADELLDLNGRKPRNMNATSKKQATANRIDGGAKQQSPPAPAPSYSKRVIPPTDVKNEANIPSKIQTTNETPRSLIEPVWRGEQQLQSPPAAESMATFDDLQASPTGNNSLPVNTDQFQPLTDSRGRRMAQKSQPSKQRQLQSSLERSMPNEIVEQVANVDDVPPQYPVCTTQSADSLPLTDSRGRRVPQKSQPKQQQFQSSVSAAEGSVLRDAGEKLSQGDDYDDVAPQAKSQYPAFIANRFQLYDSCGRRVTQKTAQPQQQRTNWRQQPQQQPQVFMPKTTPTSVAVDTPIALNVKALVEKCTRQIIQLLEQSSFSKPSAAVRRDELHTFDSMRHAARLHSQASNATQSYQPFGDRPDFRIFRMSERRYDVPNFSMINDSELQSWGVTSGLIDSHSHLSMTFKQFAENEVFARFDKSFSAPKLRQKYAASYPPTFEGQIEVLCNVEHIAKSREWQRVVNESAAAAGENGKLTLTMGLHPNWAAHWNSEKYGGSHGTFAASLIESLFALRRNVVAVGEAGLDFRRSNHLGGGYYGTELDAYEQLTKPVQKEVFMQQILLAFALNMPLVIHCRDGDGSRPPGEAYATAFEMCCAVLPEYWPVHVHCYSGSIEIADKWLRRFPNAKIGFVPLKIFKHADLVSIGQQYKNFVMTRGQNQQTNAVKLFEQFNCDELKVVKSNKHNSEEWNRARLALFVEPERMLLETDAPFFVPQEVEQCDSELKNQRFALAGSFVKYTAKQIAAMKCLPEKTVIVSHRRNVREIYGI